MYMSSRRRHTRYDLDWSSVVCSSDLHRDTLFKQLSDSYDKLKDLTAQLDAARKAEKKDDAKINDLSRQKAEASIAYEDLRGQIDQTNLSFDQLQSLVASGESDRNLQLAALKEKFPEMR